MSESSPIKAEMGKTVVWRMLAGVLLFSLLFFWPAGTLRFWEAWAYLVVLFGPMSIFAVYLLRHHQPLLARRLKAREAEPTQRWILVGFAITFLALFLVPGFDRRFGWSAVPLWLVVLSDLVVLASYVLIVYVLLSNQYAARTIEVEEQQQVVSTGPYALVRHPMYAAMTWMILFSALALGSYWALLPAMLFLLLLVARILNEEEVLHRDLAGYDVYCTTVRYRLIPGIW